MFDIQTKFFQATQPRLPFRGHKLMSNNILEIRNLSKTFSSGSLFGKRRTIGASKVSFALRSGEALALVGESGSGKSTLARLILRLEQPDSGQILIDGSDVLKERGGASLEYRGRVQMVFQDPFGSLNPIHTIAHHLERPILRNKRADKKNLRSKMIELLSTAGLEPAEDFLDRNPDDLSGGQRQRVAIARALAAEPQFLVADEPTSMLDVSIRMGILNLLARLKNEQGLGILLITHDLASARYLADRILVLYKGRVVEDGPAEDVVSNPAHPYTQQLLGAIAGSDSIEPAAGPRSEAEEAVEAAGCPFTLRCGQTLEGCSLTDPLPRFHQGRKVRCHLYPEGKESST